MAAFASLKVIGGALLRDQAESQDIRMVRQLVVGVTVGGMVVLLVVGTLFMFLGATAAGLTYLSYLALNAVNLTLLRLGRLETKLFVAMQMTLVTVVAIVTCFLLGGVINSGGVLFYGFLAPLAGLLTFGVRAAVLSLAGYVTGFALVSWATATEFIEPVLSRTAHLTLLGINATAIGVFVIAMLAFFVAQRDQAFRALKEEEDKTEALLLNILPASVASSLKAGEKRVARHYDAASILFADVANFTPLAAHLSPDALVEMLNEVFTEFDRLVERYGLEKIKTIGDAYMVAAGVPEPRPDHAVVITQLALDMMGAVKGRSFQGYDLTFRIGVNSGPVVAGIIGERKFSYDLWGHTVNMASRFEQFGVPGRIQIGEETRRLLGASYDTESRGGVDVKGEGMVSAYLLGMPVQDHAALPRPHATGESSGVAATP